VAIDLKIDAGFPDSARELLTLAKNVSLHSYNPYSGYLVGAAVETGDGSRFAGCFMENASAGITICAEPSAILTANAAGHRDIVTMAVVGGDPQKDMDGPCTPCGRCRQVLWEVASINKRDIQIYCANLHLSAVLLTTCRELLPLPWGPKW
jgi:cytidine deaminase